jgi:hypothetical protein
MHEQIDSGGVNESLEALSGHRPIRERSRYIISRYDQFVHQEHFDEEKKQGH